MFNNNYNNSDSFERLSRILKNDKLQMPQMIERSLKKDILKAISGYMNIKDSNSDLRIEIVNNGNVLITFEGVAEGFKVQNNKVN